LEELILLNVPFSEKDEVKSLGARWNPNLKKWYIPSGFDTSRFARWLPAENEFALSPIFFVESHGNCWKCNQLSEVYCIASYGLMYVDEVNRDFTTFSNLENIDSQIAELIHKNIPLYKPDYSQTVGGMYYMNHCEHCSAKMGDFYMHEEPGGAFVPIDRDAAMRITLLQLPIIKDKILITANPGYQQPDYIELYAKRKNL
jgi:Domain of unknown function (DUF5710)